MFTRILVPLDGGLPATAALAVGDTLAERFNADLHVLTILEPGRTSATAGSLIERHVGDLKSEPTVEAKPMSYSVAEDIATEFDQVPQTLLVMQTWARGRSAGIVGNVSEKVLRLTRQPLIVLGPEVEQLDGWSDGPLLIATDGSHFGDTVVPFAAEIANQLSVDPELITVIDPASVPVGVKVAGESNALVGLAGSVQSITGKPVNYDVLHNDDPALEIVDHAKRHDASFIAMSTHGRSGFARVTEDSVAMKVVRHANCPVILNRPPTDDRR